MQVPLSEKLATLTAQVQAGDEAATAELYLIIRMYSRYWVVKHLGVDDADDKVHDLFLVVLKSIRRGDIRDCRALMSYTRTVTKRFIAAGIAEHIERRNGCHLDAWGGCAPLPKELRVPINPQQQCEKQEKIDLMVEALALLSPKDQEILRRFYLDGERWESIAAGMNLTDTQFRLNKSRAKARLTKLVARLQEQHRSLRPHLIGRAA